MHKSYKIIVGVAGDETYDLTQAKKWTDDKIIELISRILAKDGGMITFDWLGVCNTLRNHTDHVLVLRQSYTNDIRPILALADMSDYMVIISNGQPHSKLDILRQSGTPYLEVNYLLGTEQFINSLTK